MCSQMRILNFLPDEIFLIEVNKAVEVFPTWMRVFELIFKNLIFFLPFLSETVSLRVLTPPSQFTPSFSKVTFPSNTGATNTPTFCRRIDILRKATF